MEDNFTAFVGFKGKVFRIVTDDRFLKHLDFVSEIETDSENPPEVLQNTISQLKEYLSGTRKEFDLPLCAEGTDFQKKVWDLLLEIPYGVTWSYKKMAEKLGNPKVIRAAASANGKNPISIVIPCHRVIGSDGSLVGYGGGLENKRFLLDLENANGVLTLF